MKKKFSKNKEVVTSLLSSLARKRKQVFVSLASFDNKKGRLSARQGFSLIEVLISLFVLSFGITAIAILMVNNIKNLQTSKNQIIASMLAQEGIELVRNYRDNNPSLFYSGGTFSGDYRIDMTTGSLGSISSGIELYLNSSNNFYTHTNTGSTATKFYRQINVSRDTGNKEMVVTSYVIWSGNSIPTTCNISNKCVSIISVMTD